MYVSSLSITAQTIRIDSTYKLTTTPSQILGDAFGRLYLSYDNGVVAQLDSNFVLINDYQPQGYFQTSQLQILTPQKIFIFYNDRQSYVFLNRFMQKQSEYELDNALPWISNAIYTLDNHLIGINTTENTLVKINPNNGNIVFKIFLQSKTKNNHTLALQANNPGFVLKINNRVVYYNSIGTLLSEQTTSEDCLLFNNNYGSYCIASTYLTHTLNNRTTRYPLPNNLVTDLPNGLYMHSKSNGYLLSGSTVYKITLE